MLVSTETVGRMSTLNGLRKFVHEPVLALLGVERAGSTLSCELLYVHGGLIPEDYPLSDGTVVRLPPELCSRLHKEHRNVTLEVVSA